MKKAINALLVLLTTLLTIPGSLAAEKNKPEIKTVDNYIAVFDIDTTGRVDKDISQPLTDSIIYEFSASYKYKIIDRGNMNKILSEQKFQISGCVAQECKVEAGQLLGVGKIVSGSVGMVGKTYYLTLQLIDVRTGEIVKSAEDKCKCEIDELLDSTKRLAKKLLGEKVDKPGTTAPKPATVAEEFAKAKAETEATAKAKAEEIARAKTEADELARQKALDAEREQLAEERRKIETEKQQLAMAKRSSQSTTGETARDGRFIAYSNGTVLDTRTNLMWAAKDNGSNINWTDAKSYCGNYRGGGYTDWRMPTQDEFASLYDKTKTYQSECRELFSGTSDIHLTTELIRLTCYWVWASDFTLFDFKDGGSGAATFSFGHGAGGGGNPSLGASSRALPVRSGE